MGKNKIKEGKTTESTGKGRIAILRKMVRESFIEIISSKYLRRWGRATSYQGKNYHIKCDNLCKKS